MNANELVKQYKTKEKSWLIRQLKQESMRGIEGYKTGKRNLENFLNEQKNYSIVPILDSGLKFIPLIKKYVNEENLVLFRPKNTHSFWDYEMQFHDGIIKPENKLLFLDDDVYSGAALTETAAFFTEKGCLLENMYAYIHNDHYYEMGSYKVIKVKNWLAQIEERYEEADVKENMQTLLELQEL